VRLAEVNLRSFATVPRQGLGARLRRDWYNPIMKECPLCGERMRLTVREIRDRIPGQGTATPRVTREWVCAECDYFEEADAGEE
jgi:uncharacterized protein with PIN domain